MSITAAGDRTGHVRNQPAFYNDLDETLQECWRLLRDGVANRRSAFHTPTLASLHDDGAPTARTVVLRALDPQDRTLRFHTDLRSTKYREITADSRVALHVYDRDRKIQLRIEGVALLHADDETAAEAWRATRPFSRQCYRIVPAPGSPISDPREIDIRPDTDDPEYGRGNFVAVSVRVDAMEWLYLSACGHRRACFQWNGAEITADWLVP